MKNWMISVIFTYIVFLIKILQKIAGDFEQYFQKLEDKD